MGLRGIEPLGVQTLLILVLHFVQTPLPPVPTKMLLINVIRTSHVIISRKLRLPLGFVVHMTEQQENKTVSNIIIGFFQYNINHLFCKYSILLLCKKNIHLSTSTGGTFLFCISFRPNKSQ